MPFILHTRNVAANAPIEYIPCGAFEVKVGDALTVAEGGAAVKATGSTVPTHVSVTERAVTEEGEVIGAVRIDDGMTFETELSVDSASIAVGAKYTIDSTGAMITATEGGPCEIVTFDGTAAGDRVVVRLK